MVVAIAGTPLQNSASGLGFLQALSQLGSKGACNGCLRQIIASGINRQNIQIALNALIILLAIFTCSSCAHKKPLTLMPTPVVYQMPGLNPFAHLAGVQQSALIDVYYCTLRAPGGGAEFRYTNTLSDYLHLGQVQIQLGQDALTWQALTDMSLHNPEDNQIPLHVKTIVPMAQILRTDTFRTRSPDKTELTPELAQYIAAINAELDTAVDKEIMVYVHGTKVDFTNAVTLAGEIDHFAGRDFVAVAFAWPSHQNIINYLIGQDVHRAIDSNAALGQLLVLLADHTHAKKINILSYSAGGRVASRALHNLAMTQPPEQRRALASRLRLGSVVFAAADVPVNLFLERLPSISGLVDRVVITLTDNDQALKTARLLMGGKPRAGSQQAEKIEEQFVKDHHLRNVEIIDVSIGAQVRGFDITGHHYWYRHPWMSSDIVFLLRTDLPASRRGLSASEMEGIWYLGPNYPAQIAEAAFKELKGQWFPAKTQ